MTQSLHTPHSPSARRLTPGFAPRPLWLRTVFLLGGLFLFALTWVVLAILSVPSASGGWLPTALAFTPALLALTLGVGIGRRWWASVAGALAVALLLGSWAYRTAPPEPERLRATASKVGVPGGWRQLSATSGGSTWGLWADWPRLEYVYATRQPPREAAAVLATRLADAGWSQDSRPREPAPGLVSQAWHQGRRRATFSIEGTDYEGRRYDPTTPADLTKVSIVYE